MSAPKNAGRSAGADRETAKHNTSAQDRSTGTAAQERRIIAALRTGPQTTDDLRALGVYQPNARIFYLRAKGYTIVTALFDGMAADGFSHHRMARYALLGEPQGEQLSLHLRRSPQARDGGSGSPERGSR